jgi:tetratricopeptide (TPR) repeat protein
LHLQQGDANKSLSYLAEAEADLANDKEYLNILAHAYIASGQLDKFRKVIEHLHSQKAGSLQPLKYNLREHTQQLAEKYNSASLELIKQKNLFDALLLLNQSLDINETAKANRWIGQIFLMQKEFQKSLPYLKKAETMGLESEDLYYNLAAANYYLDHRNEAVRYLNKLKKIKPDYPDPAGLRNKLKAR